jgi:Phage Tail Collar Domain
VSTGGRRNPFSADSGRSAQGQRLSEEDRKAVARLLSDPTYFPTEFRAWIKSFIEGSGITLPASSIIGGGPGNKTGLPAGIVILWPGVTLPPDCLVCDGSVISRSTYQKLFQVLATTWGAGDGSTTFNLPDFRDRSLYGVGSRMGLGVGGTDGVAFGSRGGPDHQHAFSGWTAEAGLHNHGVSGETSGVGDHDHGLDGYPTTEFTIQPGTQTPSRDYGEPVGANRTQAGGAHSHTFSGGTSDAGDHQHSVSGDTSGGYAYNHPSFAGIYYAITTGGISA